MKENEVRIRVWESGYYQNDSFVSASLPYLFIGQLFGRINIGSINVGHVSIETKIGYLSVWPKESVASLKERMDAENSSFESDVQNERREPNVDRTFTVFEQEIRDINKKILNIAKGIKEDKEYYQFKPTTLADVSISRSGNCCTFAWSAFPRSQTHFFRKLLHDYGFKTPNSLAKTTTGSMCFLM